MSEKRAATSGTVTRGSLITVAQAKLGFSRRECKVLIDDMLDILSNFLVSEGDAKLSSFGRFQVRSKRAREGRNPKTGERVPIAPRKVVSFRPSLSVRARIRASAKIDQNLDKDLEKNENKNEAKNLEKNKNKNEDKNEAKGEQAAALNAPHLPPRELGV